MATDAYQLKRDLKRLSGIRGYGTELISVYVPPDFQISDEIGKLKDEYGQAGNIKSKTTRQNVQGALDKIIQYLKMFKTPPKNGIAVFSGNISNAQANPRIELFPIEPPQPIKSNIYRCDSTFLLEPLEAMMEAQEMYLLLVMDGRDATLGTLKGTYFELEKKIRSFAHAKVRKGGQSAGRYERAIEESIDDYYKNVGDAINDVYKKYGKKIAGLVVGGPGPAKENFVKAKTINYQVKVMGVFDTGYTDEHTGIKELLSKASELLSEQASIKERAVMERFMEEVARGGLAVSGYAKVKEALDMDNVSKLIVSEGLELTEVRYRCSNCREETTVFEEGNFRKLKHECGGNLEVISEKDAVGSIIALADRKNIDVVFISVDSEKGNELLLEFHGIAAMLRYKK